MKIAVLGYYNALNAGDDRLQFCLTRMFQGHTIVFLPHYLTPPKEYLQSFDWILIGGGGLVFERVGVWHQAAQWLKDCNANIGVLGLGVNQVSDDLMPEVEAIIRQSKFFYVRDRKSHALLNDHPQVEVHPDLTWCYPFAVDRSPQAGVALNLLPCHWKPYQPEKWVQALSHHQVFPFPFHFGKQRDFDLLNQFFAGRVPPEFLLQPLVDSEILVACRFHAIIFAMQLGRLFVAINYDHKVYRLLADSDLLECCLETDEPEKLAEKIEFVMAHRSQILQKIEAFRTKQLQQAEQLRLTVQAIVQPHASPKSFFPSLKSSAKQLVKRIL
jgi:polysaccharide pyruvyl transferase WcaK-like protein